MEKFSLSQLSKKLLIDLYTHGYDSMNSRLFRFIKYSEHYRLLELLEKLYPTDQGRGVLIRTNRDWEFIMVEKTSEE